MSEKDYRKQMTKYVVIFAATALTAYDIIVYSLWKGSATLSTIVGTWMMESDLVLIISTSIYTHLLASGPQGLAPRQFAIATASGVVSYICTRSS